MNEIRDDLIESEEYPGFFQNEDLGIPRLYVSKDGKFVDIVTKVFYLPKTMGTWPYPQINVLGYGQHLCHRLVAQTFLQNEMPDLYTQVNHKDGNKENYQLGNLEWVTVSENAIHAYTAGLRQDNRPMESKDLRTGEIKSFYCLQECARHFNVNGGKIHHYLKAKSLYPFQDFHELRYVGEEWRGLSAEDIGKKVAGVAKSILVIGNGEKIIYPNVAMAAKKVGMKSGTLLWRLVHRKTDPINGFVVMYLTDYTDHVEDAQRIYSNGNHGDQLKRIPVPIRVTNLSSGIKTDWDSTEAFAMAVGANKNSIQKSMWANDGIWRGHRIEYLK